MDITIEKGVERPDVLSETLEQMEVGDSFLLPDSERVNVASRIYQKFHSKTSKRFKVTKKNQPDGMLRCFRIEDQPLQSK